MLPTVCEQHLDFDRTSFDRRCEVFDGHRRHGGFAKRAAVIGTVAGGKTDLKKRDGRDPDQPALNPQDPLVVGFVDAVEGRLVDQPSSHRHAAAITSGLLKSAVRAAKRSSCSRVNAGSCCSAKRRRRYSARVKPLLFAFASRDATTSSGTSRMRISVMSSRISSPCADKPGDGSTPD